MDLSLAWMFFIDHVARKRQARAHQRRSRQATERAPRLCCVHCRNPVTREDAAIRAGGAHEHRCVNPAGLTFRIGCFSDAPGCAAFGEATTEHTWFPGCAWRVAECARCGLQLGWRYEAPESGFFGLILDRLTPCGPR